MADVISNRFDHPAVADQSNLSAESFDQLAEVCEQHLDMPTILEMANDSPRPLGEGPGVRAEQDSGTSNLQIFNSPNLTGPHPNPLWAPTEGWSGKGTATALPQKVRLGIAHDEAFHFYYPDNLEALVEAGAELVDFSPISDTRLPADLDGLYFGGGYPEMFAARLAENAEMLSEVRQFAASGRAIYAECGGLMYLGQTLTALAGVRYPMAGVLPIWTAMLGKLKSLGYAEVTLLEDSLWGPRGATFRGHEFHYSEFAEPFPADSGWQKVYSVKQRSNGPAELEGFQKGRILASYVHGHFAAHPRLIESFLGNCGGRQ